MCLLAISESNGEEPCLFQVSSLLSHCFSSSPLSLLLFKNTQLQKKQLGPFSSFFIQNYVSSGFKMNGLSPTLSIMCYFIAFSFCSDQNIVVLTPYNPFYLLLATIQENGSRYVPINQLLEDGEHPLYPFLSRSTLLRETCEQACDTKGILISV